MFQWLRSPVEWTAAEAKSRLRQQDLPDRLRVRGRLDLAGALWLIYLPREVEATSVVVSRCVNLRGLPERLRCEEFFLRRTDISCLPLGLHVSHRIDAQDCRRLEYVAPLRVPQLSLPGCTALVQLSEGLIVDWLDVSGCTKLSALPVSLTNCVEVLDVSFCTSLQTLPDGFERLQTLNLRGCSGITQLPEGIRVRSAIEVADSGLRSLPWSLRSVRVLWRGIPVPDRIAFDPESITVEEILAEANVEMRRILLDRFGVQRFVEAANAIVVDRDHDAGGERRMLRIPFPSGEDVVCMEVRCPSTGNNYILRVPLDVRTCAEAAAWLAGYSDPANYRPLVET